MAKKKKGGGKKGGGKGGGAEVVNAVLEFPPEREKMTLLYRKASFDVLPPHESTGLSKLIKYQQDHVHRSVVPGYAEFLKERKFWMTGDEVPDGAIPKAPAPPKAKDGGGKKKKK
ncbi:Hypothetical Protein FCC1311_094222 [Hondaea fermentalgiana]|uniref:Uncharacterized protein n=1 Tax=Hondaea fermentalgiana TaxID=2315210 RepID=A0A2R5GTW9_9STRA|nr:Hypothetical Protein FCC1311_094222 [Hondaea fermentalgiana]|eukprot:GBG33198.1 Hypothetical Protein FCC1311_094222 [Hondaea fermentalgiana]